MGRTGRGKTGTVKPSAGKAPATKKGALAKKAAKAPSAPKGKAATATTSAKAASALKGKAATATATGAKATKGTSSKLESLAGAARKVSAADMARAESLLAEIGRRKERIVEDYYEIGLALRELSKKELFRALGYSSFEAMLDARGVMSLTTARRLIQLVSTMSRDEAITYGQEKALALLAYAKATPEVDTPKSLVEGGKLPGGKPIVTASVRELKEAAKHARASAGKGRADPLAKLAATEAKALHTWLHARGLRKVKVEAVRSKEGYLVRVEMNLEASGKLRGSRA